MKDDTCRYSLLDEAFIRYRRTQDGELVFATLPDLFIAMAADAVRDFPGLRPHQRHPWHAFLAQIAAIALHRSSHDALLDTTDEWREALRALTPDDAAWYLVSPPERPALLQAPVPEGLVSGWKEIRAADDLDMLVTSRHHDLKAGRARSAPLDQWLFALISLQTQEGVLGAGNYGISRMNSGYGSRPGIGIAPVNSWGLRWSRDVMVLLTNRDDIATRNGQRADDGNALLWLQPWDGNDSLAFSSLDPLFVEICRRVRLRVSGRSLEAIASGSKASRVAAKELNGLTGDPWTPIDPAAGKALTITSGGFNYKLVSELLFGAKYVGGAAQQLTSPDTQPLHFSARGIARGQGKTEGYHERHVPISPKVRSLMTSQKAQLAQIANERVKAIADVRKLLWSALTVLFNNGVSAGDSSDGVKNKADDFTRPFEAAENIRFFDDLTSEVESSTPSQQRLSWTIDLAKRAEEVLQKAFTAGPRSGMQRYRAQAASLSRFCGGLGGPKSPLPDLANHYRQQRSTSHEEHVHDDS